MIEFVWDKREKPPTRHMKTKKYVNFLCFCCISLHFRVDLNHCWRCYCSTRLLRLIFVDKWTRSTKHKLNIQSKHDLLYSTQALTLDVIRRYVLFVTLKPQVESKLHVKLSLLQFMRRSLSSGKSSKYIAEERNSVFNDGICTFHTLSLYNYCCITQTCIIGAVAGVHTTQKLNIWTTRSSFVVAMYLPIRWSFFLENTCITLFLFLEYWVKFPTKCA